MKSFSSSAINKSGKKFAPKAPVRRAAPAPAAARRPSATQRVQPQAAQNSQEPSKETDSTEKAPVSSSTSPAILEQPAVPEEASVAASQETVKPAAKPAAVPIPLPSKRNAPTTIPVSQSIHTPTAAPIASSITTIDGSTSPRTVPTQQTIVPSIERDVEQALANEVALEVTQSAADVGPLNEPPLVPEPILEPQQTPPIQLKRAKKTSDITKPKSKPRARGPLATPPATQATGSTARRASATPTASGAASSATLSTPEPSQASTTGKKRKASKAGTSDFEGSEKPKRTRRRSRREPTPEDAETVEILPNVIKMSELCKDLKTGRKSKREIELRRLDAEEQERKQRAQNEATPAETPQKSGADKVDKGDTSNQESEDRLNEGSDNANGPVMRIVNGEIVLDASSLQVDRHADAQRDAGDMITVEENQLTRKINQATYGKRTKTESWDEEMTELFYRGLRMFGTDFQIISNLFPGRSRRQIKLKFNNEERKDPQRIKDTLLGPRETIGIEAFQQMTNATFENPKDIQRELDAEKAEIEKQHEKEKQLQEEMLRNPTGAATDENAADDKANAAPAKGKKRNTKKKNTNISGGTEEVLGTIDD